MKPRRLGKPAVAHTGMLIRRPVAEVFEAFVDPAITSQFWFTRGSARLEAGKQVQWDWEMYGIAIPVDVKEVDRDRRIIIEWPGVEGATTVEWTFTPCDNGATFVDLTNAGFVGDGDQVAKQAAESTEGFVLVLAGLKALLEHRIRLNLVADRFPKGIAEH